MELIAKKLRIRGIVQGVFFRESTRKMAEQLGVVGWVRNRLDGSVEVFVQGEAERVAKLVEWARQGPPRARVDEVACEEAAVEPGLTSFERRETA